MYSLRVPLGFPWMDPLSRNPLTPFWISLWLWMGCTLWEDTLWQNPLTPLWVLFVQFPLSERVPCESKGFLSKEIFSWALCKNTGRLKHTFYKLGFLYSLRVMSTAELVIWYETFANCQEYGRRFVSWETCGLWGESTMYAEEWAFLLLANSINYYCK